MEKIICLDCRIRLFPGKDRLECKKCGKTWKLIEGVPYFSQDYIYWGELTRKEMIAINKDMEKGKNWKNALKDILDRNPRKQFPEPYSFATDLSRANWIFLTDLKKNGIALDIGGGLGTVSEIMSHYCKKVYCIEPVDERIRFCKKRFEQEGIKNIQLIKGNALQLPFEDNTFDLVVMNGVLEWVGVYSEKDPREAQKRVLSDIMRILKPGGVLYVGIENRLSYTNFIGKFDPHVNLVFIALMPRFLANLYSKAFTGKKYKTYIYSHKGYKKLFRESGYSNIDIYNVLPDYNLPVYLIPMKGDIPYEYLVKMTNDQSSLLPKAAKRVIALLAKAGLAKYFLPAYVILAKK